MQIKPKCQICHRIFLGGQDGCCGACQAGRRPRKKPGRLSCLCGNAAVTILLGEVISPEGESMLVEIPLCRKCELLEIAMEVEIGRRPGSGLKNPFQLILVKNLPRARRSLRGVKV